jgi:hypothetical protein
MPIQTGVAYFDARAPRHTLPDLDDMVNSGCTYVIHCMSEFDWLWSLDSIKHVIDETKARGMDVWIDPWGVGEVFGGEPFSRFGALHPEARQVGSDGITRPAACLNQPAFREYLHTWIDAAAKIGGETVFWDEPSWVVKDHGVMWSCRCELCQGLFRERFGMPMPLEYAPEVRAFLEESMAALLSDACLYGRRLGLANALCVMPTEWGNPGFTDWERAAVIQGLDNFGADPYWGTHDEPDAYVTHYAAEILRVASKHGLDHHLWVQAFEIRKGHEPEIGVAIDAAARAGIQNIAAWSYDGCAAMSTCECADPQAAWEEVRRGFRRVRGMT